MEGEKEQEEEVEGTHPPRVSSHQKRKVTLILVESAEIPSWLWTVWWERKTPPGGLKLCVTNVQPLDDEFLLFFFHCRHL